MVQDLDQGQPRVEAGQPLVDWIQDVGKAFTRRRCCFRRVCRATSFGRRRLAFGWRTCILVFLHDYNVEAPVDVFLKSFQIFLAVLAAHSVFPPSHQRLTSPTAFPAMTPILSKNILTTWSIYYFLNILLLCILFYFHLFIFLLFISHYSTLFNITTKIV